ncbi:MAG: hypothetical protein AAB787_01370 [Patescibacteria group bacterium]
MTKKIILAASIFAVSILVAGAVLTFGTSSVEAAKGPGVNVCVPETTCTTFFNGTRWDIQCVSNGCDAYGNTN